MRMWYLAILWDLLQFLSSETWSSCQRDLSLAWLESHQGILYYLWLLWRVSFPYLFLIVFILWLWEGCWFVWVNFVSSHFVEVFIMFRSSLVEFWRSLKYSTISSANRRTLFSSFPIRDFLAFFCCQFALARTSSTILNRREWTAISSPWFQWDCFKFSLHLVWCWLLVCSILILLC